MKKYIVILITLIFLITGFTGVSSEHINQFDEFTSFHIVKSENEKLNYNEIPFPPRVLNKNSEGYDYVIITTNNLENSVLSSSFINWKESLGFNIKIVKITDLIIQEQQGNDIQAKIRNFLREYYQIWGINYVLIVGDHETIPMRYCYPDPENHNFDIYSWSNGGEVPTDYYYADLSLSDNESWDSDEMDIMVNLKRIYQILKLKYT